MQVKISTRIFLVAAFGILSIITPLLLISCGDGGNEEPNIQPIDVRGKWVGTFTSRDYYTTYTVHIDITNQKGVDGEGTWYRDGSLGPGKRIVSVKGFSRDGDTPIASFYGYRDGEISCCGILGCIEKLPERFSMGGKFENETVVDNDAYYWRSCSSDYGTMIVNRVELY